VESLCSVFFKIDRIHYFNIRYSTFDICHAGVSSTIKLAAFQAGGGADSQIPILFSIRIPHSHFRIQIPLHHALTFRIPPSKLPLQQSLFIVVSVCEKTIEKRYADKRPYN
jgi:hypothetical protein